MKLSGKVTIVVPSQICAQLFQTIKEEHEYPVEESYREIPEWVNGSLYRNGPGMYEVGEYKYNHWFDPLAMITRFHIENKKVTYQNRYLKSDTYKTNLAAQRIVVSGFGTLPVPDPCQNIFQRFLSYFIIDERIDNTNVNLYPLKDELYACTETQFIRKCDPETLETLERVNLRDYVAVHSATAHPHFDEDGTIHNIGNCFKGGPKICIIKIPPKKDPTDEFPQGQVMSAIKSSGKISINYIHSFGMTENYNVYVEQPLFLNLLKIMTAKIRGSPMSNSLDWYPDLKTRFRIFDKKTGEEVNPEIKYEADPLLVFHHINAYEANGENILIIYELFITFNMPSLHVAVDKLLEAFEKISRYLVLLTLFCVEYRYIGHIIVDICALRSNEALSYIYLKDLSSEQCEENWRKYDSAEPRRFILPLDVNQQTPCNKNLVDITPAAATAEMTADDTVYCTWELLADTGMDFPQINYQRYNGKKYRYTYGTGWHPKGKHFNTVMKIDIITKTFKEWGEDKCYPSEPVFVANPDGTDEDDGVVLSAVNNSDHDKGKNAFLLVLDAKSMTEIARAEFDIPRFPKDFHGLFKTNQ
ncbi:carotenoid-cleaving dioxygenase, mitochondrial-like [Ruditapes philippinarum]|uniref:carotenoid-cleaving dioxygenase, mitochondrial-like n=1 Tax=Ruditapes philippinarum TaxID=129788 RepID=UPI00295AC1EA|nr:carotenoid-cleaving dioxygenase, mitochondrial-like [Ruditapes philippinarum]